MSRKVKLLVGAGGVVALLAVLLAGLMATGTVLAQTPPAGGNGPKALGGLAQTFISKLASNLGIGEDTLKNAVKKTETDIVDDNVKSGKITQQQGDKLKERIQNSQDGVAPFGFRGPWMGRPGKGLPGMGRHFGGAIVGRFGARQVVSDTAQILNVNVSDITTDLRSGKSLAEIAASKNMARQDLINALVQKETDRINQLVTNGKLTDAQAKNIIDKLPNAIGRAVDMKFTRPAPKNGQGPAKPQTQPQRFAPHRGAVGNSL